MTLGEFKGWGIVRTPDGTRYRTVWPMKEPGCMYLIAVRLADRNGPKKLVELRADTEIEVEHDASLPLGS